MAAKATKKEVKKTGTSTKTRKKTVVAASSPKSKKTDTVGYYRKLLKQLTKNPRTRIYALLVLIAVLLASAAYFLKGYVVAATVNGKPISRISVISELEKQGGADVLDNLINQNLIFQEAQKNNMTVTQAEIDEEIALIEENLNTSGTTLDDALAARNQTREELDEQIKVQKIVEKLLKDSVSVTDEEVEEYFTTNREMLGAEVKLEDVREDIKNQLEMQKLSTEYREWISDLRAQAQINYFATY